MLCAWVRRARRTRGIARKARLPDQDAKAWLLGDAFVGEVADDSELQLRALENERTGQRLGRQAAWREERQNCLVQRGVS